MSSCIHPVTEQVYNEIEEKVMHLYPEMLSSMTGFYMVNDFEARIEFNCRPVMVYDVITKELRYGKTSTINREQQITRSLSKSLSSRISNVHLEVSPLSKNTGIRKDTIIKYINGTKCPSYDHLCKIASALDCDVIDLVN